MEFGKDKKRSANFSSKEEGCLVALAKKYKHIVECKMSDTKANHMKTECWSAIEQEFNATASGEVHRSVVVLRKKYENIKKRVKKKHADEKCYMRGTGGGPSKDIKFNDVESEVRELLGARVEGLPSEFGGDSKPSTDSVQGSTSSSEGPSTSSDEQLALADPNVPINFGISDPMLDVQVPNIDEEMFPVDNVQIDFINGGFNTPNIDVGVDQNEQTKSDVGDWSKYTPDMLRTKKSAALQIRKSKSTVKPPNCETSSKISQWAAAKTAVEESRSEFLEKVNALQLKHIQERHDTELTLMRKKSEMEMRKAEMEMRFMEEEHKEKMRILRLTK